MYEKCIFYFKVVKMSLFFFNQANLIKPKFDLPLYENSNKYRLRYWKNVWRQKKGEGGFIVACSQKFRSRIIFFYVIWNTIILHKYCYL